MSIMNNNRKARRRAEPAVAIYHFTAKVISGGKGRSAVAAAAYRSASQLHDYRQDLTFDYAANPRAGRSSGVGSHGFSVEQVRPQFVRRRDRTA
jgi:hypothetical protein